MAPAKKTANQERVEDSAVYEAVRDATETKVALAALAESTYEWVRENAKLARGMP
ncbi:MAG: hypothetical protein JSS02_27990 [Planctomycetes bacterium]|nr:hypothetical protein [Planctomycetota bacterium]